MRNFNIMSDEELNKRYLELITDNTPMTERQEEIRSEEINDIRAEIDKREIVR